MAFNVLKILKGLIIKEDNSLTPKQIAIIPGGNANTTATLTSSQITDVTIILPNASGTLVTNDGNVALTSKTINADANTILNIRNTNIANNAAIDMTKIGNGDVTNTQLSGLKVSNQSIDASNPGSGDVTALLFSIATIRSAHIKYNVFRSTSTTTVYETGNMIITYSPANSVGNLFELTQERQGDASIAFNITDAGQVQYTCSTIAGVSHVGKITSSVIEFLQ
jgi:hypothetical protein